MSEKHSTERTPSRKPARNKTDEAVEPATVLQPSTTAKTKPAKPYPEFPLTAHPAGYWCKKIRGKIHYFGPWDDPDGALKKYLADRDALHAGRTPRPDTDAVTVKAVVNAFLNAKQALVDAGELSQRMWSEYKEVCDMLVKDMGKSRLVTDLGPSDFAALRRKMAKRWGPVRLGNAIQRIRSVCKYAADADLIGRPVKFGPDFKRPTKKVMRVHRAEQGPKLFTAAEVRALVQGALVVGADGPELVRADPQLRAMAFLGINCGFGPADCAKLPASAVDLQGGWIDYPRPKTGIPRRCPLWPETIAALREVMVEGQGLVFVAARGGNWHKESGGSYASWKFGQLLRQLGINGRKGLGLYTLRHTFRTVADESKDQPAADYIMGHESPHMSTIYRERISDERLRAVTDHVRGWLFGA